MLTRLKPMQTPKMGKQCISNVQGTVALAFLLSLCLLYAAPCRATGQVVIHCRDAAFLELRGYDGLAEKTLFKGELPANGRQELQTSYQGLALLVFAQGQTYPLILGNGPLTVQVTHAAEPPAFPSSPENLNLYKALTDNSAVPEETPFAALMIQARKLLDSSYSLQSVTALQAKREEFQRFVAQNFARLRYSDMVRRLIAQSFMMHEYVSYHEEGKPAATIKSRYQQEVLACAAGWLATLSAHSADHQIINYCVALYYNRSMVTMASILINRFKDSAYCPGEAPASIPVPDDLRLVRDDGKETENLGGISGEKILALVSEQCPVSMVAAVAKARSLSGAQQATSLIIAPLEKLSDRHLAMNSMLRDGRMLFVSDEKWRQDTLSGKIRLPMFLPITGKEATTKK